MLTVSGVSKTLGDHLVLDRISFSLNTGERVGLVGPNGAGKSTLLAVIAGAMPADTGSIVLDPRYAIGFLRQGFSDIQNGTLQSLLDGPLGGLLAAAEALDSSTNALARDSGNTDALLLALDRAMEQFEKAGGYGRLDELQYAARSVRIDGSVVRDAVGRALRRRKDAGRSGGFTGRAAGHPAARRADQSPRYWRARLARGIPARVSGRNTHRLARSRVSRSSGNRHPGVG